MLITEYFYFIGSTNSPLTMSNQETRETILLYQMDTLITFQLNSISWVIKEEFAQLDTFPPNPNADFFFSFAMLRGED